MATNFDSRQVKDLTSINDLKGAENTTFIIKTILTAPDNSSVILGKGVALIFEGGQLLGNFTLQGNHTSLEAPITQIFGEGVNVIGSWNIQRAYPQWFDNQVGTEPLATYSPHDCAPAINAACKMKTVGEVYFTPGYYFVGEPIVANPGIALVGVPSSKIYKTYQKDNNWANPSEDEYFGSSIIVPFLKRALHIEGKKVYEIYSGPFVDLTYSFDNTPSLVSVNGYHPIIRINIAEDSVKGLTWESPYSFPYARISNLYIANRWEPSQSNRIDSKTDISASQPLATVVNPDPQLPKYLLAGCVGCMIGGGFLSENVHFYNFLCAVKCAGDYNDMQSVVRCTFETWLDPGYTYFPKEFYYTLDLRGMGDALLIEECGVHGNSISVTVNGESHTLYPRVNGSIALRDCKGGTINSCILNADALIEESMAIVFSANHMEYGAQLKIKNANVAVTENYFEKGDRPSIAIIPTDDLSDTSKHNNTYSIIDLTGNNFMLLAWNDDRPTKGSFACQYDIQVSQAANSGVSVHLLQNFRLAYYKLRSNHPTGIWLCDENGKAIDEFNDYSYFLSRESTLVSGGRIIKHSAFTEIPNLSLNLMANANVIKAEGVDNAPASDAYTFTARVIIDKKRRIYGSSVSIKQPANNRPYQTTDTSDGVNKTIETGMLIGCEWKTTYRDCIIQFTRTRTDAPSESKYYTVEVPVCAPFFLYDNSASINGFEWQLRISGLLPMRDINTNIESVAFNGENVVCRAKRLPAYGTWVEGDIIINTDPTSAVTRTSMWVYTSNGWMPGA